MLLTNQVVKDLYTQDRGGCCILIRCVQIYTQDWGECCLLMRGYRSIYKIWLNVDCDFIGKCLTNKKYITQNHVLSLRCWMLHSVACDIKVKCLSLCSVQTELPHHEQSTDPKTGSGGYLQVLLHPLYLL